MSEELRIYMSKVLSAFEQYAKMSHHLAFEGLMSTLKLDDADRVADILSAHLMVATAEKQSLLELLNPYERLQRLHDLLDVEIEKINIDKRINVKVKKQMEKAQKEYYLNEKIKAIHQELGRKDDRGDELAELREKIEKAGLPKEVKEKAEQELKRLEAMPPVSAEATVSRNYIDWLVAVPWRKKSKERKDLDHAEKVLNEDHYGLEKIKDRILEFLAVRQLVGQTKSSIICFVGPPGVGKSSLAKSIARATGRKFVRLSLGGVRDEAEIRGHRRTYIGAFPGQIIQMMRKAGTINPIFLLDEVDKMSMDFRGDPSAALLEVLDPEQNDSFLDHYLDVDYDLSKVMFIATANVDPHHPAAAAGPHGDHPALGLHAQREAGDRPAVPGAAAAPATTACRRDKIELRRRGDPGGHRELHPRGGRAQPGARDRLHLPQDRPPGGQGGAERRRSRSRRRWCSSSWASRSSAPAARTRSRRWASRPASPGPRSAASCWRPRSA